MPPLVIADERVCDHSPIHGREGRGIYYDDFTIARSQITYYESHFVDYYKDLNDLIKELEK